MKNISLNNFDLIRLFAALQVAITHITTHLGFNSQFLDILKLFPGVPVFFFISGFLIYGSYVKSKKNLKPNANFFMKRFLRIYPALYLYIFLSLLSVWQSGYFSNLELDPSQLVTWIASQVTIFQFYNPEFMRGYGTGVLNGSLWTIAVELQFYLITPFLFLFLNKANIKLIGFILFTLISINIFNTSANESSMLFNTSHHNDESVLYKKLFNVSFLPWYYMFVLGALVYKFNSFIDIVKKMNLFFLLLLYVLCYLFTKNLGWYNNINPIAYFILILLIIKCAYSVPDLSDKLLRKNDISYGIYIFHMPIVNYLLYKNIVGTDGVLTAIFFTFAASIFSWFALEKVILAKKRNAQRKI